MNRVYELADQWIAKLGREPTPNDEDALVAAVFPQLTKAEVDELARMEIHQRVEEELIHQGFITLDDGKTYRRPKGN